MMKDLKIIIELLSCGDFKIELNHYANGQEGFKKELALKYLTSTIPCSELQKFYNFVGGWE